MDPDQLSELRQRVLRVHQLYEEIVEKSKTETEQYVISAWRGILGYIYQIERETGFEFEMLCHKFGYSRANASSL